MKFTAFQVLAGLILVFLIPIAVAVVSHSASQVIFSDEESLQTKFNAKTLGKWQGSSNIYYTEGNVGIGTNNPQESLQVSGNIDATGQVRGARLCIGSDCRTYWPSGGVSGSGELHNIPEWNSGGSIGTSPIYEGADLSNAEFIGIGTASPNAKLHVTDTNGASLYVTGNGNGDDARIYMGQETSNGGGIKYDGGTDKIEFFRRESGTDTTAFSYSYNNGRVTFNDGVTFPSNTCVVRQLSASPSSGAREICDTGEIVVGGGGKCSSGSITESFPGISYGNPADGYEANAWAVSCSNSGGTVTAYAICCKF